MASLAKKLNVKDGMKLRVIAKPSAVDLLACPGSPAVDDAAVQERIEAAFVVQRRRNARRTLLLRPDDIGWAQLTAAPRANRRDASGVVGIQLSGSVRVPFLGLRLHDDVRGCEKQQTVADYGCAFPARRQSADPPSFCPIREIVGHETLIRFEVASQDDNFVDAIVAPVHRRRPTVLKQRAVRLPHCSAVTPVDGEQVRFLTLMVEHEQLACENGRGSGTIWVICQREPSFPYQVSFEVVAQQSVRAEVDIDALPVSDGRRSSWISDRVHFFDLAGRDSTPPENFAGAAIDRDSRKLTVFSVKLRQEDVSVPDAGRR